MSGAPSTTEAGLASCSASSRGSVNGSVTMSSEANCSGSTRTATSKSTIHTRAREERILGQMQEMFLYMDLMGGMSAGFRSGHSFGSPALQRQPSYHALSLLPRTLSEVRFASAPKFKDTSNEAAYTMRRV